MSARLLIAALALGLALLHPGTGRTEDGGAGEDLEKQLNADVKASWLISITDLGDILLFGGGIRVPVHRPSVDRCGEWLTVPPESRAKRTDELLKEADRTANDQKLSKNERQVLKRKTLAPLHACEGDLKKRCEEARSTTTLETRKAAVAQARRSIGEIVNAKDSASVKIYLATLLKQCPLEE
jgi:hypothetical protein